MKYILADNKIYETEKLIKVEDTRFPDGYMTIEGVPLIAKKQADTIEELCDEFIWKWNKEEYPYSTLRQYIRYAFGELNREMRDLLNYGKNINLDYKVYGAIWTDKGLIYVAKLNEKGELELI